MDRLWAIKKNFDPFGRFVVGFSSIGFLLRITRCTVYRCPYCRWVFKITWGPSNALLGSGERSCWHCRQVFWDGSSEWPDMSGEEQQLFLFPISVAGYIGGFLVVTGLYLYLLIYSKKAAGRGELIVFSMLFLPIVAWFCFRAVQVIRSVRRYNSRGKSSAA